MREKYKQFYQDTLYKEGQKQEKHVNEERDRALSDFFGVKREKKVAPPAIKDGLYKRVGEDFIFHFGGKLYIYHPMFEDVYILDTWDDSIFNDELMYHDFIVNEKYDDSIPFDYLDADIRKTINDVMRPF